MDLFDLLRRLPAEHAGLLVLVAAGLDDAAIARALDVPPEAVPLLRDLARRKVSRIVGRTR